MKKIKNLIQKKATHKIVALALVVALCLGSAIGVLAKQLMYTQTSTNLYYFFKQIPPKSVQDTYNKMDRIVDDKIIDDDNYKSDCSEEKLKQLKAIKPYLEVASEPKGKVKVKASSGVKKIKLSLGNLPSPKKKHIYEIYISNKKSFENEKCIKTNKRKYTIKNLRKKTKYYIKVRFGKKCLAFQIGLPLNKKNILNSHLYGPWSAVKSVKTK